MASLSRTLYRGLAAFGAPRLARGVRPGAPVLCFHNVVPEHDAGVGDASLHMPVGAFASIVRWMASTYEVVPVRELADRASSGRSLRGLSAVTFDDAYRGVFDHALPVLAAAGLPSTIFVVSGFADRPAYTWWDILASRGLLSEERRDRALSEQQGLAEEVLAGTDADGSASAAGAGLPEALLPAPWDRIEREVGDGVDLGSHTVRHANLPALRGAELDEEVARSRRQIADRTGKEPEALAYPYGNWTPEVLRATARAGYRVGLTLGGHPCAQGDDLLGMPRINVPAGISVEALACWAAGLKLQHPW